MRTFVVEKYGQDSVSPADRPEPTVGDRDVLVRVVAAGINPPDKLVRNGEFKQLLPTERRLCSATTSPAW